MKNNFKRNLAFIFFFLAGVLAGNIIADICHGTKYFDWLSFGKTIGFGADSPVVIDLIIFEMTFGISFSVNVAQIITVIIALFAYSKTCKKL